MNKVDLLFKNAKIINVYTNEIESKDIAVKDGIIQSFTEYPADIVVNLGGAFVCPGFIDSHVHIESSMVSVSEFTKSVLSHGTTTIVADPHEIANVSGKKGLDYMLESAENQPVDIHFMIPSCVPATSMETSGAVIDSSVIEEYIDNKRVVGLGEMMNYPGVIYEDIEVMSKIGIALSRNKLVDGHAPSLSGEDLYKYVKAGISSDHEAVTFEEALEKISLGMRIMVREGTCAKNLEDLFPAINEVSATRMMWCTDDRHPHDIKSGHINDIVAKAIKLGLDPCIAIRMATLSSAEYFGFKDKGAVAPGKRADLIVFDDLTNFIPRDIYKNGKLVVKDRSVLKDIFLPAQPEPVSKMNIDIDKLDFSVKADGKKIRVIGVIEDQVVTNSFTHDARIEFGEVVSDISEDILKMAVVERYSGKSGTGIGFVNGFNLKRGAFASSVAHDSHNILVVGENDADMKVAVKEIVRMGGGFAVANAGSILASLALPIAGLMSMKPLDDVISNLDNVLDAVHQLGVKLRDPFISLGFLSLPVIPKLKLTDHGLIDVTEFKKVSLFI